MFRVISSAGRPVAYPFVHQEFRQGMVAQMVVDGNEVKFGLSDGTAPFGFIDDNVASATISGKIAVWYSEGIYITDEFDVSEPYWLNCKLFVRKDGRITSKQTIPNQPSIGICLGPPTDKINKMQVFLTRGFGEPRLAEEAIKEQKDISHLFEPVLNQKERNLAENGDELGLLESLFTRTGLGTPELIGFIREEMDRMGYKKPSTPASQLVVLTDNECQLIAAGERIQALKSIKERTNCSLKEAVDSCNYEKTIQERLSYEWSKGIRDEPEKVVAIEGEVEQAGLGVGMSVLMMAGAGIAGALIKGKMDATAAKVNTIQASQGAAVK